MASMYSLNILLCVICLFKSSLLQNSTDPVECVENGLTPDDESDSADGLFMDFAERLELYTGLGNTESSNFTVTLDECGSQLCVVNANGTAIWDARMDFYLSHMSRSRTDEEDRNITLDGCLCNSHNLSDYQICMRQVREKMIAQLDTVLIVKFKKIIGTNCSLFNENCLKA